MASTEESGDVVVEVSGLGVRRGKKHVLDGVDWSVRRGEQWVIMGANGCGKTSLLSTLTGYLTPTSGQISVFGQKFGKTDWRELRKAIGIVSSSVRQLVEDGETALEVVASGNDALINLWEIPPVEVQERARKVLAEIECSELAERRWVFLSQGERQRVLIGRALMARPQLVILDEPCAGLDPIAREHFLSFVGRLSEGESAPTLVLVTHHVEEVIREFNRVMLMRDGKAFAQGEKEDVLTGDLLGEAFGAEVTISKTKDGRYAMQVGSPSAGHAGWEIEKSLES